MSPDMCVPCGEGLVNIRVGALIADNFAQPVALYAANIT